MNYTYLIGWSQQNQYYYGVRYSKHADPKELWTTYFTSSRHVANFRKIYGEPDIVEIRKEFLDSDKAREWECRVLTKLRIPKNPKFLNKTNNKAIYYERNEEWKRKRSGINHHLYGQPSPFKGKTHTQESKDKNRKAHLGKKTGRTSSDFTDAWKKNISNSKKGQIRFQTKEERLLRSVRAKESFFFSICKDRIWINDGTQNKRIPETDLHLFPEFRRGRIKTNRTSESSQH